MSIRQLPSSVPRSGLGIVRWAGAVFERCDDGVGGPLQRMRRRIKFWARCCRHPGALRASVASLHEHGLDRLLANDPSLPLRVLRPYLRSGLRAGERAAAFDNHFRWLARHMPPAWIDSLYAGRMIPLLAPTPIAGLEFGLAIPHGLGREGELALHLHWQGQRAMSLAFSIASGETVVGSDAAADLHAVVGVIQGLPNADGLLRDISSACERLRPTALMVVAMQALCAGWQIGAPLCVAPDSHVYAGYRSQRRRIGLDYDTVWKDAGGTPVGSHYWLLPPAPRLRPDAEVESRHRAQHRRRNALRTRLFDAVSQGTAGMLLREPQCESLLDEVGARGHGELEAVR